MSLQLSMHDIVVEDDCKHTADKMCTMNNNTKEEEEEDASMPIVALFSGE